MSRPVVLMFPGQGAQRARMAAGLYRACPVFTCAADEALGHFGEMGISMRADWLSGAPIDAAWRAQPLLFAVGYALGRMVLSWGTEPAALIGHSVGEITAATLAGVFTVADAAALLLDRITSAACAPPGDMLAVAASADEVTPFLGGSVTIGAVNAPRQVMLAGLAGPLRAAAQRLREAGFTCRPLGCGIGFHSPAAAPIAAAALPTLRRVPLRPPTLTVYSAYSVGPLTSDLATDPQFWARHVTDPVLFWPTLGTLLSAGNALLADTSPGGWLATVARRHPAVAPGRSAVTCLLPAVRGPASADREAVHAAAERIRAEGHHLRSMPPYLGSVQPRGGDGTLLERATADPLPPLPTIDVTGGASAQLALDTWKGSRL